MINLKEKLKTDTVWGENMEESLFSRIIGKVRSIYFKIVEMFKYAWAIHKTKYKDVSEDEKWIKIITMIIKVVVIAILLYIAVILATIAFGIYLVWIVIAGDADMSSSNPTQNHPTSGEIRRLNRQRINQRELDIEDYERRNRRY